MTFWTFFTKSKNPLPYEISHCKLYQCIELGINNGMLKTASRNSNYCRFYDCFNLAIFRCRTTIFLLLPSSSPENLCTDLTQQPVELGFWKFLYTFLMVLPRDVFWFIAIAPAVATPPPKKRHNHVYHHSSATNGPRLLKFSVHLPYGITLGCILIYCNCASGYRPALQKTA